MGTTAKNSGGDFPKAPIGTHIARCYQVIDLGHQKTTWQGKEKWQPKILLTWELCNALMDDGKPFSVSNRYTLSLSEQSVLRPILEAWRGKPFSDEELAGFDVKKVLGAYCMLGVVHNNHDGKTYANVSAILPMPQGVPKPAPINDALYFNIDTDDVAVLPEWLQNTVKKSRELSGEPEQPAHVDRQQAPAAGGHKAFETMMDDIPF